MTSPALTITGLTKRFGASAVLGGIDLTVPGGSLLTLVGESGSGKSTLLRIIAGLETPDAGQVSFGDRPVGVAPGARTPAQRGSKPGQAVPVGFVFQKPVLYSHLSLKQNILFAERLGRRQRLDRDHFASLIDSLGLGEHLYKKPDQLSGGQAQRAGIARALVRKPPLILFDEPLSSVDEHLSEAIRTDLITLHSHLGFTGIYVTHNPDEALAMGQQLAVLEGGRLAQVAAPGQVLAAPTSVQVARLLNPLYNELVGDLAGQPVTVGCSAFSFSRDGTGESVNLPVTLRAACPHPAGTRLTTRMRTPVQIQTPQGTLTLLAGAELTAVLASRTEAEVGQELTLALNPAGLHLFPAVPADLSD